MADEDWRRGHNRYTEYELRNGWGFRREGLKGRKIRAKIVPTEPPKIVLSGSRRGPLEVPIVQITRLRAGIEHGKYGSHNYRCIIWRQDAQTLTFRNTFGGRLIYGDFILHLAEEMDRVGAFDRVERGLRSWENVVYTLLCILAAVFLGYVAYDTMKLSIGPPTRANLFAGGVILVSVIVLIIVAFALWGPDNRPRQARNLNDFAKVLP